MPKSFKKELEVSTAAKLIKEAQEPVKEVKRIEAVQSTAVIPADVMRPKEPKETLSVRLNLITKPSTRERLRKYCEENYVSLNEYINALIEADLSYKKY